MILINTPIGQALETAIFCVPVWVVGRWALVFVRRHSKWATYSRMQRILLNCLALLPGALFCAWWFYWKFDTQWTGNLGPFGLIILIPIVVITSVSGFVLAMLATLLIRCLAKISAK